MTRAATHNRGRERKAVSYLPIKSNLTRTQGLYEHNLTLIRIPQTLTLKTTAVNDLEERPLHYNY